MVLVKFFAKDSYNFLSRLLLINNKKSRLELTSSIKKTALIIPSTYDSCEPEKFSPLCHKTEKKRNINSKYSKLFFDIHTVFLVALRNANSRRIILRIIIIENNMIKAIFELFNFQNMEFFLTGLEPCFD